MDRPRSGAGRARASRRRPRGARDAPRRVAARDVLVVPDQRHRISPRSADARAVPIPHDRELLCAVRGRRGGLSAAGGAVRDRAGGDATAAPPLARHGRCDRRVDLPRRVTVAAVLLQIRAQRHLRRGLDGAARDGGVALPRRWTLALARADRGCAVAVLRDEGDGLPLLGDVAPLPERHARLAARGAAGRDGGARRARGGRASEPAALGARADAARLADRGQLAVDRRSAPALGLGGPAARGEPDGDRGDADRLADRSRDPDPDLRRELRGDREQRDRARRDHGHGARARRRGRRPGVELEVVGDRRHGLLRDLHPTVHDRVHEHGRIRERALGARSTTGSRSRT